MPTTWNLHFDGETLNERIECRGEVEHLRGHPDVEGVEVEAREACFHLTVTFREGVEPKPRLRQRYDRRFSTECTRYVPRPWRSPTDRQRDGIIRRALATPEGRQRLAASMVNPIRTRIDYQSVARRAFLVEPLQTGALPTYDRDQELNSYDLGTAPRRVQVPNFELAANPTVQLADIRERRFNLIDRATSRTVQQIQATEDQEVFSALDTATQDLVVEPFQQLTREALEEVQALINAQSIPSSSLFMAGVDHGDLIRSLRLPNEYLPPENPCAEQALEASGPELPPVPSRFDRVLEMAA
jgi:hypothetical protein